MDKSFLKTQLSLPWESLFGTEKNHKSMIQKLEDEKYYFDKNLI